MAKITLSIVPVYETAYFLVKSKNVYTVQL